MTTPWLFPLGAPADARRSLPVFSFLPNWKGGITERLEWMTEVFSSEIAVEQRRSQRRFPRRSFEAGFLREVNERTRMDLFLTGIGKNQFLVPLWHEQFALPDGNSTGLVTFPTGTLVMREWRVNDLVLVTNSDPNVFNVLTVTAKTTNSITLKVLTSAGVWEPGSRIIPLRVARIMDQPKLTNVTSRVATAQLRFELSEADDRFIGDWGGASPVWAIKPDRRTELTTDYFRSDFVQDFNAGVVDVIDPGNRAQVLNAFALTIFGRADVWAFRSFLYAARGRMHRFYTPTFTDDIVPVGNIAAGVTFDAQMNGFTEYMPEPQQARLGIVIKLISGSKLYRTITNTAKVLDTVSPFRQVAERFTLSTTLPAIQKSTIEGISFVVPSRFDQDAFEILHHTADCRGISSSVVMRSSIVAGMTAMP